METFPKPRQLVFMEKFVEMIKVIAFDYTGVVAAYGPIKKWIDANIDKNDKRYLLYKNGAEKWDIGEMTLDEMYLVLSEITGVPAEKLWGEFFEKQILNAEVVETIKNLKKKYKVLLFSNHHGELLRKLLVKHNITHLFDNVIVSSEHRKKKPNTEFFDVLVEISGVSKNEILFIDDSKENIVGGQRFGIKSLLFTNPNDLITHLRKEGITL